jgi:hypothetical protein
MQPRQLVCVASCSWRTAPRRFSNERRFEVNGVSLLLDRLPVVATSGSGGCDVSSALLMSSALLPFGRGFRELVA